MLARKSRLFMLALMTVSILGLSFSAQADRGDRSKHWRSGDYRQHGYKLDDRHRHNRYYPRRGITVRTLPQRYRTVHHRHTDFYFSSGVWFRSAAPYYVVTAPPVGVLIPALPSHYTTVWVSGLPYYYAAGTYYVWAPDERAYRVVAPPPEQDVTKEPQLPQKLFVYPKQGQNEEQLATDRYQCYDWAARQTEYDPTQPGGGVPAELSRSKRTEYNRAMQACLEGRGYSVQ